MNCLYITLFFNTVAGIVQTFIKSWNQLLYPRVIEVCCLHFEPRHDFFLHLIIVVEIFPSRCCFRWRNKWKLLDAKSGLYSGWSNIYHLNTSVLFFWSSFNIVDSQRAQNFLYSNFSITASWIVVLDTSGMMWCNSLIVTDRFERISSSVSWRMSSEIKDGLPLLFS